MMPFIMPTRTESAVYFDVDLDAAGAYAALAAHDDVHPGEHATLFHVVLWALGRTFHESPNLNRFVAGSRLYQRRGVWLSFSAKEEMAEGAPILVVKRGAAPSETLADVVADVRARVRRSRQGEPAATDREVALLLRLPRPVLRLAVRAVRRVDAAGLLPRRFVADDPFFASAFVVNLGSVGLGAAFHHLYEYGTIGVFCAVGRAHAVDGRPVLPVRFTFDERVDDGLAAAHALARFRELFEHPERAERLAGDGQATAATSTSSVNESARPSASDAASGQRPGSAWTPTPSQPL